MNNKLTLANFIFPKDHEGSPEPSFKASTLPPAFADFFSGLLGLAGSAFADIFLDFFTGAGPESSGPESESESSLERLVGGLKELMSKIAWCRNISIFKRKRQSTRENFSFIQPQLRSVLPENFSQKTRRHSQITETRTFHAKTRKSPLF